MNGPVCVQCPTDFYKNIVYLETVPTRSKKKMMNTDWGRPSPLDELRNQSGYFPDLSRYEDTESVNTFQEESRDEPNTGTNRSIISFETVQTNERLLDKLDLNAEDEALLQQALKEEEEKTRSQDIKKHNGPIICMPASKFPSLRSKGLSGSRDLDHNVRELSLQNLNLRGNLSSSAVEQHYAAKSRYSYFAEEDTDSELAGIAGYEASYAQPHAGEQPFSNDQTPRSVVSFENYRLENTRLINQYPQLYKKGIKLGRDNGLQPINTLSKSQELSGDKTPQKGERLYQNGSGNSTKTSFVEVGQLSQPKTHSSLESNSSLNLSAKGREESQEFYVSTPSPVMNEPSSLEISKQRTPTHKTHSKKPSFSFKNLFKSPRSAKARTPVESRSSFEQSVQSSVESSPKKRSQNLRKFIFPANPVLHFDPSTPRKTSHMSSRKPHHFRSLSDFHKTSSPSITTEKLGDRNALHPLERPRRKLSLDSRRPAVPVSSFQTPPHSRQQSRNNLQFSNMKGEDIIQPSKTGSSPSSNPSSQIDLAIQMRNRGKLKESAKRLHNACLSNDGTAHLLYGLALRHGCGVSKDYKESLRYLKAATGVKSETEEIFDVIVDPFEIERNDSLPQAVPEPFAPALYECGMAYLKGYGLDNPDEQKGLKYLEKAAALGHIDSMCLSATIWSKKSTTRKKDVARAAVWFRLAERRGANLIGSDWIHKEKYTKKAHS